MWSLRKPTELQIQATLSVQGRLPYAYRGVGGTLHQHVPAGYRTVHYRTLLGTGHETFVLACRGLQRWQQFPAEMVEIHPRDVLIESGNTVGVLIRQFGVWLLMATRIVYTIDLRQDKDDDDIAINYEMLSVERFGFAYGTLPSHLEAGEERFLIEWDRRDNQVWYDLHMFCKPGNVLARAFDWRVKQLQRRFARLSAAAMQNIVRSDQQRASSDERAAVV